MKGVKTKKDKKKEKKEEALYGPASFDFGDDKDDDDSYNSKYFGKKKSTEQEKVTIQSLFEFKPWEVGVLVIELLLVLYLVLVVLRIIPIF